MLVNEYDGTFTAKGKTLGGVVKFLCDGAATKMSLSLSNIDTMRMGNWYVYVFADGKYFMFERRPQIIFPSPSIEKVSVIITAERIKKFIVGFADASGKINKDLAYRYGLMEQPKPTVKYTMATPEKTENQSESPAPAAEVAASKRAAAETEESSKITESQGQATAQEAEISAQEEKPAAPYPEAPVTEYEKFIMNSGNYYIEEERTQNSAPPADGETLKKIKAIQNYSEAVGKFDGKDGYYTTVREEISDIFETFPVHGELTEKIGNSVWAKITRKNGKFFALGLILEEGRPKYICYALPSKTAMRPDRTQYLDVGGGFWLITQDAQTGKRMTDARLTVG